MDRRNERIGRNDIISGPLWGLVLFIGCQRHPINKIEMLLKK